MKKWTRIIVTGDSVCEKRTEKETQKKQTQERYTKKSTKERVSKKHTSRFQENLRYVFPEKNTKKTHKAIHYWDSTWTHTCEHMDGNNATQGQCIKNKTHYNNMEAKKGIQKRSQKNLKNVPVRIWTRMMECESGGSVRCSLREPLRIYIYRYVYIYMYIRI